MRNKEQLFRKTFNIFKIINNIWPDTLFSGTNYFLAVFNKLQSITTAENNRGKRNRVCFSVWKQFCRIWDEINLNWFMSLLILFISLITIANCPATHLQQFLIVMKDETMLIYFVFDLSQDTSNTITIAVPNQRHPFQLVLNSPDWFKENLYQREKMERKI